MKIFTLFKLCVQFLLKPGYVSKMKEKNVYIFLIHWQLRGRKKTTRNMSFGKLSPSINR